MTSDIGNREWLNDSEPLKRVNPNNPFTVPDSYFNELNERIVSGIRLNDLKQNSQQEFTVPENYFNELSGNIMSRIKIDQALNQSFGFTTPNNYFEDLTAQIQSRVKVEEALVGAEETMTVPDGYFERLNKNILNKTVNQDIIKRKTIVRRMFNSPIFKYATAACLLAIVGGGVFFKSSSDPVKKHRTSYLHQELLNVSEQEMESYLRLYADGNEALHIIKANDLSVNDAQIQSDLNTYIDTE
ncbi:hypothetical protein GCM10027049_07920 [Mucilaginibacter puniceus]